MNYAVLLSFLFAFCTTSQTQTMTTTETSTFHELSILNLDETDTIDFSSFKGKKVLLVNVASKCGYTYQYEGLQKLYEAHSDSLVVIGFPCNQFMFQEPGSKEKIAEFCSATYGVTFPMTTKIKVKGDSAHPIYQWLTNKELNGVDNYKVKWNFTKFLVNEEGELIGQWDSKVKPEDPAILAAIKS